MDLLVGGETWSERAHCVLAPSFCILHLFVCNYSISSLRNILASDHLAFSSRRMTAKASLGPYPGTL